MTSTDVSSQPSTQMQDTRTLDLRLGVAVPFADVDRAEHSYQAITLQPASRTQANIEISKIHSRERVSQGDSRRDPEFWVDVVKM